MKSYIEVCDLCTIIYTIGYDTLWYDVYRADGGRNRFKYINVPIYIIYIYRL